MLESLLSETLAVTADNLQMTVEMLKCAQEVSGDLPEEARQKLNLVHIGVALALEALEDESLSQLVQQSMVYRDLQ